MSNGHVRLTIPCHDPINAYAMGAIAADAGFSPEEFKDLITPTNSRMTFSFASSITNTFRLSMARLIAT
jgi:hypothetical protein